jgi:hypothetical protein
MKLKARMGAAASVVKIALLSGALAVGSFLCREEGIHHSAAEPQPNADSSRSLP